MSNYRHKSVRGGTYFFTAEAYRRQKFLCNENVRAALRNGLLNMQQKHPFHHQCLSKWCIKCTLLGCPIDLNSLSIVTKGHLKSFANNLCEK